MTDSKGSESWLTLGQRKVYAQSLHSTRLRSTTVCCQYQVYAAKTIVTFEVLRTTIRAGMTPAARISVMPDLVDRMLLSA